MFRLYLKIALFLLVTNVYAQSKLPPVVNFSVEDYKGGNQNWGVDTSGQIIYVANNEGLLEFDGVNWYLNRLPNRTIVRSVKVVDNKIYTGSYEEFGYWERTEDGSLEYTSLSKELNQEDIASQSIWDIYEFNNKIVFKSFGILYVYDFKDVKVVKPYGILLAASVIDNRFFVHGKDKGLLELVNDELVLVPGTEKLGDEKVEAIIPYNGKLLLGTSLNGCYTYANGILEKWNNILDSQLKENQLNTLSYSNGNIYFGTIKNGVYQYDVKNDSYINLNVKNGLQNNTVLASLIDNKGNLWLALDNGISAVPIEHYSYYLNPYKADIGAVYDIADLNGEIFVATNTGIYKMLDKGVEFIEGSQGHTWSLTVVDNEIICGHNSGTFSIKNGKLITVEQRNGGYVFKKIPGKTDKYIQTNYSGLTFYEKVNGNWSSYYVTDISLPIKNIVFEKDHTAWVVHAYKGIYKIFFADDYKSVTKIEGKYNKEFQNLYDIKIFEVEGNVAFFNNENWYVYNPLEDNIKEFSSLRKVLGKDKKAVILNEFSDAPMVFKRIEDDVIFLRKNLQDSISQIYLPKKYYENRLVRGEGEQKAVVANDSLLYIALYDDVLAVNPQKISLENSILQPFISRIFKNGKLQELGNDVELKRNDTIQVQLGVQYLSNYTIEYAIGDENWKKTNGNIVLSGLPYGDTNLKIRSYINSKEYSNTTTIKLFVKSPWYLGVWGLVAFINILLFILYLITTINKYVLIKHKRYLDEQYKHQQEIHRKEEALKNEKKVNELLKRQHEIELKAKTKELANTAMEMTKKDELLENIKDELGLFKKEIIDKSKFEKLLSTINKNINTSKDWEVFESNFNEIHDSFFKSLVKKHSHLTPKDLKLCAYLKMNLSTKEIAPLMGISARGVEIHRYRLRKKLNLDSEQNLNEYLMNLI